LAEIGFDHGMPHWLIQMFRILNAFPVEKLFLGWNSFYHFRKWFRDELSDYVQDTLLDARSRDRPYFNKTMLTKMVTDHVKGNGNFVKEINLALTVELIHRTLIDQ